ncbi:hypothetical protein LTS10_006020 [Elasticomyces elasticus]|nr:hypothetical protein LTS10_006020 [Elasticomyces elasticus]
MNFCYNCGKERQGCTCGVELDEEDDERPDPATWNNDGLPEVDEVTAEWLAAAMTSRQPETDPRWFEADEAARQSERRNHLEGSHRVGSIRAWSAASSSATGAECATGDEHSLLEHERAS